MRNLVLPFRGTTVVVAELFEIVSKQTDGAGGHRAGKPGKCAN